MTSVLRNWAEVMRTQNLAGQPVDRISRWLLITRASVFPMTLIAGAVGGLLAAGGPAAVDGVLFTECLIGLVLAHAANNMVNDYFDLEGGVDSEGYVRNQYAPHALLSGLTTRRGLWTGIAIANAIDLAILLHLTAVRGWPVVVFALAGLFVSFFYVAPPFKLKHRGLGELGVFLVWGPLMIAGTYFVATGALPAWVWAASLPYGFLVTAVLMGKHVDKLEADRAKGIRTLPVILGPERSRWLTQALLVGFFVLVAVLVLTGTLGVWCLVVFAALRPLARTLQAFEHPPPESAPPGYPVWPLWYVAWAFRLTRFAGLLFVAGLLATAWFPVYL